MRARAAADGRSGSAIGASVPRSHSDDAGPAGWDTARRRHSLPSPNAAGQASFRSAGRVAGAVFERESTRAYCFCREAAYTSNPARATPTLQASHVQEEIQVSVTDLHLLLSIGEPYITKPRVIE